MVIWGIWTLKGGVLGIMNIKGLFLGGYEHRKVVFPRIWALKGGNLVNMSIKEWCFAGCED